MATRKTIAPVLTAEVQAMGVDNEDRFAVRRELARMKRALNLAADLLHGVDALMNEEPLKIWRGRAYMVEKSADLRRALSRLRARAAREGGR